MASTSSTSSTPIQFLKPRLLYWERKQRIEETTPKGMSERGEGFAESHWMCKAHGRAVPMADLQCDPKDKKSCNIVNNMYGFDTVSDESWACAICFNAADGTERHPLLSLNKAYQVYCKNWTVCGGMRKQYYDPCAWYTWKCKLCKEVSGKTSYNDVARGGRCSINDFGKVCPVTLKEFAHKDNIDIVLVRQRELRWDLEAKCDYKHKDAR